MSNQNTFTGIGMVIVLILALRGFLQVYRPTIQAGRIRVTSLTGNELWMPLSWRPFTLAVTVISAVVGITYLAVLFHP